MQESTSQCRPQRRFLFGVVLVFLTLSAVICALGLRYHEMQTQHVYDARAAELSAIADLKVLQIHAWRRERIAHAEMLSAELIASIVRRYVQDPSNVRNRGDVRTLLRKFHESAFFSRAALLDSMGTTLISAPDSALPFNCLRYLTHHANDRESMSLTELHRDTTSGRIHMSVLSPLKDQTTEETFATLVLQIDPSSFLFPLLELWPSQSASAESYLVRKEDGGVLYLSTLRHHTNAPLNLHERPLDSEALSAYIVRGTSGIIKGKDYRGEKVLACITPIPESSWIVVAKIDRAEFVPVLRRNAQRTTAVVVVLIAAAGAVCALLWNLAQSDQARKRYAAEREQLRRVEESERKERKLNEELAAKNRDLEQVVYVASHDLRSPLVNIQGFGQELAMDIEELTAAFASVRTDPETQEKIDSLLRDQIPHALSYIIGSSRKMYSLLLGLLRVARLGRQALQYEDLDMTNVVTGVLAQFDYQIKAAQAVVEVKNLPPCRADRVQMNQIISNLIDNALKYAKPGVAPRIVIKGIAHEESTVYSIADNGIGIAKEHQAKIFEIFYRLNPRESTGEGLGLSAIQRIIERHNGSIWVESEKGVGSTFHFALPVATQEVPPNA